MNKAKRGAQVELEGNCVPRNALTGSLAKEREETLSPASSPSHSS